MKHGARLLAAGGAIAVGAILALASPALADGPDAGTDGTRVTSAPLDGDRDASTNGTRVTSAPLDSDREY